MNMLAHWTDAPIAKALGWTLIHFVWEGVLIAILLAAVLAACGTASARLRYGFACLSMVSMLAAFGVTLTRLWPGNTGALPALRNSRLAGVALTLALSKAPLTPLPLGPESRVPWVVPFWMLGVLAFHVRTLGGWVAARRLRRVGVCPAPVDWQRRLDGLSQRLGLGRPVALLESCLGEVPVVIGLLRPVVLVPVGMLAGLPVAYVESILIHELAHIRRHDYLVNLLQTFIEGLLFYHPAVWWVSRVIRMERENCCDDVVVALNGDARGYAAALAALEENRWPAPQPALAATGGSFMKRIRRLLQPPEGPRVTLAPLFMSGILLVSVVAALSAWQTKPAPASPAALEPPRQEAPPRPEPPVRQEKPRMLAQLQSGQQNVETPYRKWMTEDVAYIITDEERAAFQRLQTRQEQEQFIQQFWLRRDPTPGTVENEFKEEHYRRIAYANAHFSSNDLAGWKTDRGRIYLTFGPPDEMESHPAGGSYQRPVEQGGGATSTFPFEQWLYRYIQGIGNNIIIEFVDPTMSGAYRMTTDPSAKDVLRPVPGAGSTSSLSDRWFIVGVNPTGLVDITIPLEAAGDKRPLNVFGRITTTAGRIVTTFDESGLQGAEFRKALSLAPGLYFVEVTVSAKGVPTMILNKAFEVK